MPRSPGPSRREFLVGAATSGGVSALGLGTSARRAHAERPVLRIAQWAHFVPAYDEWFDRKFARAWGDRHGVTVEVDHLALSELRARADTEVATQQGHDLFALPVSPVAYEPHVMPVTDVVTEAGAPLREAAGLRPQEHLQSADETVLRGAGELGARTAPLPEGPLGGRRGQAGHGELVGRVRGRSTKRGIPGGRTGARWTAT